MKDEVRVAMIGAGRMANSVHYPSLASFSDTRIVGISDLDPVALTRTADQFEIEERHRDYREMVERVSPDGVYVIGQPHLMYDIWTWCLQQGIPLYIEKPMGLTIHQARMLAHLAETAGVVTQVSHQRRTSPLLVSLRDQVRATGEVTQAMVQFYKPGPLAMTGARDRMMDDCVHVIDTVRWLCGGGPGSHSGADVTRVESKCRRIGTPDINWVHATLEFANGAIGFVQCNWASGRRIFRVEMHSPGATAEGDQEGMMSFHSAASGGSGSQEFHAHTVAGSAETFISGGFQAKNREFIESLKTGREVTSSPFRDAVKTMEVAETILAQALLAGV
ncbi:MAG: gfo/Idh/MocA family oxidoreductase [Proteobacteria bacterium]|nr:gfo/Idh/MocA family oxidoreductase [Pseudomonadota bacterium]NBT25668.1 gfo/Idh/MocA family oxidoreductase [Actinomycetota bacterium]NBY46702.1 gfo/Idh/MocA family oxidoreductase [Pseudomonadota bacterium]